MRFPLNGYSGALLYLHSTRRASAITLWQNVQIVKRSRDTECVWPCASGSAARRFLCASNRLPSVINWTIKTGWKILRSTIWGHPHMPVPRRRALPDEQYHFTLVTILLRLRFFFLVSRSICIYRTLSMVCHRSTVRAARRYGNDVWS